MTVTLHVINRDGALSDPSVVLAGDALAVCRATAAMYGSIGFAPPWVGYLGTSGEQAVGTCAFKSAPSAGAVEIAFFTFPGHEGQGVATAMAGQLLDLTYATDHSLKVIAHTLPERNAAGAVLRKLGFLLLGDWQDPLDGPTWEWEYIR